MVSDIFPTAWFGAKLAEIRTGDTVAVFGAGPVGQLAVLSAFLQGAGRVIAVDHNADRLALAQAQHAETVNFDTEEPVAAIRDLTGGIDVDRVIDAVGVDAERPATGVPAEQAEQFETERQQAAPETNVQADQWVPGDAPSQVLHWATQAVLRRRRAGAPHRVRRGQALRLWTTCPSCSNSYWRHGPQAAPPRNASAICASAAHANTARSDMPSTSSRPAKASRGRRRQSAGQVPGGLNGRHPGMGELMPRARRPWPLPLAAAAGAPGAYAGLASYLGLPALELSPFIAAGVFGAAIVGAAFLLSWAAEAAEVDVSAGVALAFLAFLAVLPEYGVDFVFTMRAGQSNCAPLRRREPVRARPG